MGACVSSPGNEDTTGSPSDPEARQRSNQIDKQIEEDGRKYKKEVKILLLGSGESGKSTVVKQMKIIHQNGFPRDELVAARITVFKNVLDSAQAIVMALRKFRMEPAESENRTYAEKILGYRLDTSSQFPGHSPLQPYAYSTPSTPSSREIRTSLHSNSLTGSELGGRGSFSTSKGEAHLTEEIITAIESLWHDPIIPSVLDRGSEFYLMDSASYFFTHLRRIGAQDYVPNDLDYLHARTKTTGISETHFVSGQLSIHMFDVGGQRSERKKWIHCFEAVTSVIFCVALSEYDQVLLEESGQNRMDESLTLFESVVNSPWFLRSSIILFLNKIDLFKIKVLKVPLERYFPEYTGGADVNKAAQYFLYKFKQKNRQRLMIYPHLTQATDTSNIRLVFAAVKESILQNALRDSGIL